MASEEFVISSRVSLQVAAEVEGFDQVSQWVGQLELEVAGNFLYFHCKGCFKWVRLSCFDKRFELARGSGYVESGLNLLSEEGLVAEYLNYFQVAR